jgi:hypothetical protein
MSEDKFWSLLKEYTMTTTKKRLPKTTKTKATQMDEMLKTTQTDLDVAAIGNPDSGGNGGIKKEYLKSRNLCKVTFRLPRIAAPEAKTVCIVGEFNNWNIYANPMERLRSGDFKITIELETGREYQFRYLIDGTFWENDWNADKYVKSPFGDSDNSVVMV